MSTSILNGMIALSKELGDIRKACEVGFKSHYKVIWHACIDCGKERWVRLVKGQPGNLRCLSCGVKNVVKYCQDNPLWTGGRYKDQEGYIQIRVHPDNPYFLMANKKRHSIPEHRLVMAQHLGRCLESWEIVHHKNRIRDDNKLRNLELLPSQAGHLALAGMEKEIKRLEKQVLDLSLILLTIGGKDVNKFG